MLPQDSARKDEPALGLKRALSSATRPFEALVSPRHGDPDTRRRQAQAIGTLVALGLVAAMLSPLAMVLGFGLTATLVLSVTAFVGLLAAVALAAGGESDLVAAALFTFGAVLLGMLSVTLDSFWPMVLLLVGPIEARMARSSLLFRLMLPSVLSAFGLVGFLSLHGMGPSGQGLTGSEIALPLTLLYAAHVLYRLRSGRRPALVAQDRPLFELDPDGNLFSAMRSGARAGRFSQRLHLLDRVTFLRAMDELRNGSDAMVLDLRLQSGEQDGVFTGVRLRLVPMRGGDGRLRGVRAHGEIEALPAAAPEARLAMPSAETQGAFLATVSHELRTPLNAIIGFSDILDQEFFGGFADPRQKEYVGLIRRSSQHLLEVVNMLLDVSKIEAGRYELMAEAFPVDEIVSAAAEMVQCEAERKGLRLVIRPGHGDEALVADRRACQQMLVNLLSNAVKFTEQGTVCLSSRIEAGSMVFTVTDTGIGIDAEDIDRLGRPFVQVSQGLSRRYEGTGLGLSLVKGLAELHHGSLRIKSQPGRGTTVTIRIPTDCAERIRAGGTPLENVVALTDARKKTSLLPQDHPTRRSA